MQGTYTQWLVYLSVAVAIAAAYTTLSIASRITVSADRWIWLTGGALVMGCGIWSMHFIGMLSFSLPIELSYSIPKTLLSLGIAILTSGFALFVVGRPQIKLGHLALSAVLMGAGISAMHYSGMASIAITPMITYEPLLFTASILIAIAASFAALWLAFKLRRGGSWQMVLARIGAAIVMGLAISGMHYTGMAASQFGANSYCTGATRLDNAWLGIALGIFALGLMTVTLLTVSYDAFLRRHMRARDEALQKADAQARNAARFDVLTGLPNRVALTEAAERAIAECALKDGQLALMVLNVDRLKSINDSLGHQAGDELLLELAQRLRGVLRHNDMLARLAGDEFTILATELRSARDAEAIAGKVIEVLQRPFATAAVEVHPSVSMGISTYPLDGESFDGLLRRANAAMRYTKDSARGGFRFYAAEMSGFTDDRLALESDLRRALEMGELELHYQPKVDIATNRIRSAEALLRWRHPVRGFVMPNTFIPIAEESGLIIQVGEWVLRQACRQVRAWLDAGMTPLRVAVNLSAKQFRQADLAAAVKAALEESQLEPGYLELELTESAVMHNPEQSAATLQTLSAMGVHISIDDFGTGYSSLSYLRRFPLDKLKIDRSFIRDLMTNPDDVSIVRAIISLAHSLRLRVVAEGVETPEQLNFLRELGCDQYQGYYCSPAVAPDAFAELIRRLRSEKPELTEADMLRTQSRLSAFTPEQVA
jgi:diguanylate cyclase (GGDEF)-like protein